MHTQTRRRFLRFSLRTLFVVLTVVGVCGGWIASEYHSVRQRREAVEALLRHGIRVEIARNPPSLPALLVARLTGTGDVGAVEAIRGWNFADADMAAVGHFPELKSLAILSGSVTNAGLARLTRMTALEHLGLHRLPIDDAGLASIDGSDRLVWVELGCAGISDAGLLHLQRMMHLRGLGLNGTQVTDAGLAHLRGMTQLTNLSLKETKVTDAGVRQLEAALPKVRVFR